MERTRKLWLGRIGEHAFLASPTDDDLFLAAVVSPVDSRNEQRADREAHHAAGLALWPELRDHVGEARRVGPVRMMSRWHGFFRESAGPGWALVGDAGHFKDPTPGQGISDALRQSVELAGAIEQALGGTADADRVLRDWWSWRDSDAWEMYWFARDMASDRTPHLSRAMEERMAGDPRLVEGLLRVLNHELPPSKLFSATGPGAGPHEGVRGGTRPATSPSRGGARCRRRGSPPPPKPPRRRSPDPDSLAALMPSDFRELASVDGAITATADAMVPLKDDGLYRGDGAFEVIRIYAGRLFALGDHIERLGRSAAAIELEFDRAALEAEVEALMAELGEADGQLRLIVTRGGRRIAATEPLPPHAEAVSVATVTFSPSVILNGVKSLSYAANMEATRIAKSRGADEAVLVRPDGIVLEPPTSSIFWVSSGGDAAHDGARAPRCSSRSPATGWSGRSTSRRASGRSRTCAAPARPSSHRRPVRSRRSRRSTAVSFPRRPAREPARPRPPSPRPSAASYET